MRGLHLLLLLLEVLVEAAPPHGLLTNFQASPALGVPKSPQFSWVVPSADSEPDHEQTSYHIVVTDALDENKVVWDSGVVMSKSSIGVPYAGPPLPPGKAFNWTVATQTQGRSVEVHSSPVSLPATFITALHTGFQHGASYIWSGPAPDSPADTRERGNSGMFAFFRKVVPKPVARVIRATAFVTAVTDDYMLCGYRLYIGGVLVNVGPGRGEAVVWGGNGTYMEKPYQTLDVTDHVLALDTNGNKGGDFLIAMQGLGSTGAKGQSGPACAGPCAGVGPKISAGVLMQLVLELQDGATMTTVTDRTWDAFNADTFMHPTAGKNWYKHVLENTDARDEPIGWRSELSFKASGSGWTKAVEVLQAGGELLGLHPKMSRPIQNFQVPPPSGNKVVKVDPSVLGRPGCYTIDFTREFQGGLILSVEGGVAGQAVSIDAGESLSQVHNKTYTGPVNEKVGNDWGYSFTWTLRDGKQTIEQHEYMEFRFVNLCFNGSEPKSFNLSAWAVQYEWNPDDSYFHASGDQEVNGTNVADMLVKVWELNRYTVQAGMLDTYTDSNTRERRPYEADGLVEATAHLWLQRDVMWARHSHAYLLRTRYMRYLYVEFVCEYLCIYRICIIRSRYVIQYPTWPVEWVQISVLLAYMDYWATGSTDLVASFLSNETQMIGPGHPSPVPISLHANTRLADADTTGLLNCSAQVANGCSTRPGAGHHIVDWDPPPSGSMFRFSQHLSVNNAFALRGLLNLAEIAGILNRTEMEAQYRSEAANLQKAMQTQMWNASAGMYCDGACKDTPHTGVTTNSFTLYTDLVPEDSIKTAWEQAAAYGLEGTGDYGAYIWLAAQNKYAGDDGSVMLHALTKCDHSSWCGELTQGLDGTNATMTRETWTGGTYSHGWGTGAIVGVAGGLMGITQTAPAFANFTVAPRIATIDKAVVRVPTLRGAISVEANKTHTIVGVPCGASARVCVPHHLNPSDGNSVAAKVLVLDGEEIERGRAVVHPAGRHLCVDGVGCGANGANRTLTLV